MSCDMYVSEHISSLGRTAKTYNSFVYRNIIGNVRSFAFLPPSLKSSRIVPSGRVVETGRVASSDSGSICSSQMMAGHGG